MKLFPRPLWWCLLLRLIRFPLGWRVARSFRRAGLVLHAGFSRLRVVLFRSARRRSFGRLH